jgi:hypothetical protein
MLAVFEKKINKLGLNEKISCRHEELSNMEFEEEAFDIEYGVSP